MDPLRIPQSLRDGEAFGDQYAGVYFSRLCMLRKYVNEALLERWGSESMDEGMAIVPRIGLVKEQRCMVVGTVCRGAAVSSDAVRKYLNELNLDIDLKEWRRPSNQVILEDESSRLVLVPTSEGVIPVDRLVTGMVIGVKGYLNSNGDMEVEGVTFPTPVLPPPIPSLETPCQIAFISGLEIGTSQLKLRQLFRLKDILSDSDLTPPLAKIVIAGNTISTLAIGDSTKLFDEADAMLASLASFTEVDLMPGPLDPTLSALPQPPIHGAFLPRADMFETFHEVGNPHDFICNGFRFVGTSGQVTESISRNCGCSEIEALENSLMARTLVPTAPDCVPCHSRLPDTMVLMDKDAPHVLFSGCNSEYDTRELNGIRMFTIPSFVKKASVVMVSLPSLEIGLLEIE
eukprot:Protomagalhaensia_wolfi_Nauph_80__6220@NODE_934_length_1870_cov_54_286182_g705_i0_p1_GENE_NODE_934_length_1870_cov_54_286182_g705_i0NODE_934_length_1870_cov_54_286182_g705_i0_p1_ORF_typecomplete_len402_score81_33DNA_pol_E_B/PF04042_16/4_6e26DNA_pol_D_N/PF18018_1/1_6e20_NODE_934_length_1870_cov_54_286182_g705_i06471852